MCLQNPPQDRLYPIKLTKMYWHSYNNTVSSLNTKKFKYFIQYITELRKYYFICLPASANA